MKKKKKIIILFITLFFGIMTYTAINVNAEDAEEICEPLERTYFFMKSVNSYQAQTFDYSPNNSNCIMDSIVGEVTCTDETYFLDELEGIDGAKYEYIEVEPVPMDKDEHQIYMKMVLDGLNNREDYCKKLGEGVSGAPICSYQEYRTNAGTDNNDDDEFGFEEGVNYTDEQLETFWRNHTVHPSDIRVQCDSDGYDRTTHRINCRITRTWNQKDEDYSINYSGFDFYNVPAIAKIKIYYTSPNCTEPETPSCSGEDSDFDNFDDCESEHSYSETKNININEDFGLSYGDTNFNEWKNYIGNPNQQCGNGKINLNISGTSSVEQEGNAEFYLNKTEQVGNRKFNSIPLTQIAGKGFGFSIEYSSNIKYTICNPGITIKASSNYEKITCQDKGTTRTTSAVDPETNEYEKKKITYSTPTVIGHQCHYTETTTTNKYVIEEIDAELFENNEDYYIDYGDDDNGYCYKYDEDPIEYFDDEGTPYYKYECTTYHQDNIEIEDMNQDEYDDADEEYCLYYDKDNEKCYKHKDTITTESVVEAADVQCVLDDNTFTCGGDCLVNFNGPGFSVKQEYDLYASEMANKLNELDLNDNSNVKSKNSNEVSNSLVSMSYKASEPGAGTWDEEYIYKNDNDPNRATVIDTDLSELNTWYPNEEIRYNGIYELGRACISLHADPNDITIKAPVSYVESEHDCTGATLDGKQLWYIPINEPAYNFSNSLFPVKAETIDMGLSLIEEMDNRWKLNYSCGVKVKQYLYDEPGEEFKFIYRPISLSNPFAGRTLDPLKSNWTNFKDNNTTEFNNKITNGRDDPNKVEYKVTLTPSLINQLKTNYSTKYNNLSTISADGTSSIVTDIGGRKGSTRYNDLGYCTTNCY